MQRLGRGACDPSVMAMGIYLVEPIYFDMYSGKRKRPLVEEGTRPKKKAKVSQSEASGQLARTNDEPLHSEVEEDDEDINDSFNSDAEVTASQDNEMDLERRSEVLPTGNSLPSMVNPSGVSAALPPVPTSLLPSDLENGALERAAMYAFINAHSRGFCR